MSKNPSARKEELGFSQALLRELHLLTRDGQLNQDARRKLKQIQHLLQFITPLLDEQLKSGLPPTLVDHGAGKSYLGFLLWDQWFKYHGGTVIGIERRADLVEKSQALANTFGFQGMQFISGDIAKASNSETEVNVVTALHACDTATDDAVSYGLAASTNHFVLVPCCQAEVAASLRLGKSLSQRSTPLSELWRRPLHTREFGTQVTNVLRCLRLEASGYQVTVTELVGWEHSMKNELIVASKNRDVAKAKARERLEEMLSMLGLDALTPRFAPLG